MFNKIIFVALALSPLSLCGIESPELRELKQINQNLNEIKKDIKDIKKGILGIHFIPCGDSIIQKLEKIEKQLK